MSNQDTVEPTTDSRAVMDIQPACEGFEGPYEHFPDSPRCPEPAVWILTHACCGSTILSCDSHLLARAPRSPRLAGLVRWTIKCVKCGAVRPGDSPLSVRFTRIERI